jgi:hypothetical protein
VPFALGKNSTSVLRFPPQKEELSRFCSVLYLSKDLDTRTTEEIIDSVEAYGETIRDALERLRDLMAVKV